MSLQSRLGATYLGGSDCQFVVWVPFAQNHDQVGNRVWSERLSQLVSFEELKLAAGKELIRLRKENLALAHLSKDTLGLRRRTVAGNWKRRPRVA